MLRSVAAVGVFWLLACTIPGYNPGDPASAEYLKTLLWDCMLRECYPCPTLSWQDTRPACWFRYRRELERAQSLGDCGSPTIGVAGPGFGVAQKWSAGVLTEPGIIRGISQNDAQFLHINPETATFSRSGPAISPLPGWRGGVLAFDRKIYGTPSSAASTFIRYDPITETSIQFDGPAGPGNNVRGGTLAPNGRIYALPTAASAIYILDPNTLSISTVALGRSGWDGSVLGPDGRIYGIPSTTSDVLVFDPGNNTTKYIPAGGSGWRGGVLASNGVIYGMPESATSVLAIDTNTEVVRTFGSFAVGAEKWTSGALAPNGKIYAVPGSNATDVLEIDTVTEQTRLLPTGAGAARWWGATAAFNGLIFGIPFGATQVLVINPCAYGRLNPNVPLSGYYNKF